MKRIMVTRKKFYDIRRFFKEYTKDGHNSKETRFVIIHGWMVSPTTLTRILKARNFKEYKASGQVYGKGVKSLRKRYLFILGVIAVVLLVLNLS